MTGTLIVLAILSLALLPIPCVIAASNGHHNPGGVAALALLGLLVFPLWLVAMAWAIIGADPSRVVDRGGPQSVIDEEDPDPTFEILGTNARGEQVRYTAVAANVDDVRFIAAERGTNVIAVRQLP